MEQYCLLYYYTQVKDARAETILQDGVAVLLRNLVMKERETVMDVVMEALMMEMKDARETLYVAAITAYSLVCTTMRRMTAVSMQREGVWLGRWI